MRGREGKERREVRVSLEPHAKGLKRQGQEECGLSSAGTGAMWQTTQDPVRVPLSHNGHCDVLPRGSYSPLGEKVRHLMS